MRNFDSIIYRQIKKVFPLWAKLDLMKQINEPNEFILQPYNLQHSLYWVFKKENVRSKDLKFNLIEIRPYDARYNIFINGLFISSRDYILEHENKKDIKINSKDTNINNIKHNICYIRVSSSGQKDDLEHQRQVMIKKYPKHEIIEDIGSGLNLNKRGIKRIIKLGIEGKINELVIAYKDRLTRFGYELIEDIIKDYSRGKIIVINETKKIKPDEELVNDVMSLMNVYVAKMNGLRKYNKLLKP